MFPAALWTTTAISSSATLEITLPASSKSRCRPTGSGETRTFRFGCGGKDDHDADEIQIRSQFAGDQGLSERTRAPICPRGHDGGVSHLPARHDCADYPRREPHH